MSTLKNKVNSILLDDKAFLDKVKYNKDGYYIHKRNRKRDYMVTVVVPTYNSSNTINETIESVIKQSIGFENIELLLIDDGSTDETRLIILDYAKKYSNITPVFFEDNTGSPSLPRNLGIRLARGEYLSFLDSDDWLDKDGLKTLYDILVRTKDKYAVGKTIKVTNNGYYLIGEYNSWSNRDSIDPYSIKHIFHHLGPTGRMVETNFVKKENIKFPDMRFAEDKQFFIDVLTKCGTISTSKEVIYYANRYKENKSLVSRTDIFEKTDTNISLINYVISKKLPSKEEKMILNRLYEFDCVTRLFDRAHFLESNEKDKYYKKFQEVMSTTKALSYNITDNFFDPWHKILVEFLNEERYEDVVKLINWNKKTSIKDYLIKDEKPYLRLPFKDFQTVRTNVLALFYGGIKNDYSYIVQFQIFGDIEDDLNSLVIRQRNNELNEIQFPIKKIEENLYQTEIEYSVVDLIDTCKHAVFIRYDNYMKAPIRMNSRNIVDYNGRNIDFYTTIADNLGLNIN